MPKPILLGVWVKRFLLDHLIAERNLSSNTQRSYRDTLALFLPYIRFVGRCVAKLPQSHRRDPRVLHPYTKPAACGSTRDG